jgi:hypothetical protein
MSSGMRIHHNRSTVMSNFVRAITTACGRLLVIVLAITVIPMANAAAVQRTFPTPAEAGTALVKALAARDEAAMVAILGPGSDKWIRSGDQVADNAARERFIAAYEQRHQITTMSGSRAVLAIGDDEWPFAFPLVKSGGAWHFDTAAGREELLARRIGANELAVMNVMLAIVDAQREYASADRNSDGVREYARAFASSPGKKDGLYWPTSANEPPSPLGELVVRANRDGYDKSAAAPFHGYYFRMLHAQGPAAIGGTMDYVVRGRMIGGFAVVAYPAQYGNSGIMTFLVNHDGVVYQKNLGADTASIASRMTRFDPGAGWEITKQD